MTTTTTATPVLPADLKAGDTILANGEVARVAQVAAYATGDRYVVVHGYYLTNPGPLMAPFRADVPVSAWRA